MATSKKRVRKAPPRVRRKALAPGKTGDARLKRQLAEALAQQAATAEILKVISSSPADTQPVFEAIVENARRLCGAVFSILYRYDGETMNVVADRHVSPKASRALRSLYPAPPRRDHVVGRALLEGRTMHSADIPVDRRFPSNRNAFSRLVPFRASLVVPLLRDGPVVGAIATGRLEPKAFTKSEIRLLQTFADQAVIAIENVRLFNETRDALEQQTATAEILRVIGGSMTDAQPVFDAIVKNCHTLFKGSGVVLRLVRDGRLPVQASSGATLESVPIDRESAVGTCVLEARTIHLPDIEAAAERFPRVRQLGLKMGYRSGIYAPLLRAGTAIGTIGILRPEVGAFEDKEVALLNTFADQAVIAIENVRLFRELEARNRDVSDALEQQTATAEVLASISGSMADTQPVFERIVKNLRQLFGTRFAVLQLLRGDMVEMPAVDGHGIEKLRERYPRPLDETTVGGRAMLSKQTVQFAPLLGNPATPPATVQFAQDFGFNSVIFTPMIHEGKVIGAIGAAHPEPKPFDDRQIALIKTFADQAVIAIQNARLFNETKEALEQQTATAEILRVISNSPTDIQPVLDAVAESAARLCGATDAIIRRVDSDGMRMVAHFGPVPVMADVHVISRGSIGGRAIVECRTVHVQDIVEAYSRGEYPDAPALQQGAGYRSMLAVPLVREGTAIGAIVIRRMEVRAFTDKQIKLLETFAAQAVIAIENVRLFNETKEALERQTATAEILKVISNSPTNTQPVFEAIVKTGLNLFGGMSVGLLLVAGDHIVRPAHALAPEIGADSAEDMFPLPLDESSFTGRAVLRREVVHVPDIGEFSGSTGRGVADRMGFRACVFAPMMREGKGIGAIGVLRAEKGPFTDKQIALLQTFADQAVIAIENVRLFNETREALERQTATAEILKVIASSPTDVQPVFDVIVESAVRLCGASFGRVYRYDGSVIEMVASHGLSARGLGQVRRVFPRPASEDTIVGVVIQTRRPFFLSDIDHDDRVPALSRQMIAALDTRSQVTIPMLRAGESIGAITMGWKEPGGFGDQQVALLQTFADQAVIAIENVRLFNETKEALERQTATAEILKVISSSPTDTQPVFDAIVQSGLKLFPDAAVAVTLPDGNQVRAAAIATRDPALGAAWKARFPIPLSRDRMHGAAILDRRLIDVPDAEVEVNGLFGPGIKNFLASGNRAITIMPMIRGDSAIGAISVIRLAPGPLTENQIALLRTFADQAVIAIENVRLFNETKESLERQTATAEILKVIASSPSDVQPVFDAIARSALKLIGGSTANVTRRVADELHLVALTATSDPADEAFRNMFPTPLTGQGVAGKAVLSAMPAIVSDFETDPAYSPSFRDITRARGVRSVVAVPMVREGEAIGAISVARPDPGRFTDHQVNLLKTFADQAVIAIENVRLFNETREALERQTATAEILKVISSSPTDTQPVFEAVAASAARLCEASDAFIQLRDGDSLRYVAHHGKIMVTRSNRWDAAERT